MERCTYLNLVLDRLRPQANQFLSSAFHAHAKDLPGGFKVTFMLLSAYYAITVIQLLFEAFVLRRSLAAPSHSYNEGPSAPPRQ